MPAPGRPPLALASTAGLTPRRIRARTCPEVLHKTVKVGDLDAFDREAGAEGRARRPLTARLPDRPADVPLPDPATRRHGPRHRTHLAGRSLRRRAGSL